VFLLSTITIFPDTCTFAVVLFESVVEKVNPETSMVACLFVVR
jgi:hypothetical protein